MQRLECTMSCQPVAESEAQLRAYRETMLCAIHTAEPVSSRRRDVNWTLGLHGLWSRVTICVCLCSYELLLTSSGVSTEDTASSAVRVHTNTYLLSYCCSYCHIFRG